MHHVDAPMLSDSVDMRDLGPVHECVCGSNMFIIVASFADYEISSYLIEGRCWGCGAKIIVPTEVDRPAD